MSIRPRIGRGCRARCRLAVHTLRGHSAAGTWVVGRSEAGTAAGDCAAGCAGCCRNNRWGRNFCVDSRERRSRLDVHTTRDRLAPPLPDLTDLALVSLRWLPREQLLTSRSRPSPHLDRRQTATECCHGWLALGADRRHQTPREAGRTGRTGLGAQVARAVCLCAGFSGVGLGLACS